MENKHGEQEELLTAQDAARLSGLTDAAIRTAMLRGRLPYLIQYGRKLIRRSDFDTYRKTVKMGRPKKDG